MSQRDSPPGLKDFVRLNPSTWYRQTSNTSPSDDPDLILLAGWMDASPKHIARYTAGYARLYPSASILAVTTSLIDVGFRTTAANRKRIAPALEILCTLSSNRKVLLHLFSNGGAYTSTLIAKAYRQKMGRSLLVNLLVLDSAPGRATYEATIRAVAVGLPKNIILRTIGSFVLRVLFWLAILASMLRRKVDLIEQVRRDLNETTLISVKTPRMYIYGVSDDMVAWQDVEAHAVEAEELGYTVDTEKFLQSTHVAHLIADPARYWASVQSAWRTAM